MHGASDLVGAVLTGGESRRMGTDKARLELEGRSLGARAVETLRSALPEVVVVSRRLGDHADLGAPEIADRLPGNGPLAGLHAALDYAAGRPVFALACDLPAAGPALVAHLLEYSPRVAAAGGAKAVVPELDGRVQPLCGLYSAACRVEVERRLADGALRVLDLLEAIGTEYVPLGPDLPFYREDLLDNVNDPAAAERLGVSQARGAEWSAR